MTPIESWEKKAKDIIELEYRRCLDGERFRAWVITDYFRTKLDEAYRKGREDAVESKSGFWVTCFEGNGLSGCAHWSFEICACMCHEQARHAGEVSKD